MSKWINILFNNCQDEYLIEKWSIEELIKKQMSKFKKNSLN